MDTSAIYSDKLTTSGKYTHVEILTAGTVEKNSSTIGPPAGIEPTPVQCRCTILRHVNP